MDEDLQQLYQIIYILYHLWRSDIKLIEILNFSEEFAYVIDIILKQNFDNKDMFLFIQEHYDLHKNSEKEKIDALVEEFHEILLQDCLLSRFNNS